MRDLVNEEVMYNMMSLKNYDDYTYFHSVNVGILSAVIGAHYGMDVQFKPFTIKLANKNAIKYREA